jgi:hypothetical protein
MDGDAYQGGLKELRKYCIGSVCLGMSMREVALLGALDLRGLSLAVDPKPSCVDAWVGVRGGKVYIDDAAVNVSFAVLASGDHIEDRYRVLAMSRRFVGLSQKSLDKLTATLVSRFGGMQRVPKRRVWNKAGIPFEISVSQGEIDEEAFIAVQATVSPDWMEEQRGCEPVLPKL